MDYDAEGLRLRLRGRPKKTLRLLKRTLISDNYINRCKWRKLIKDTVEYQKDRE